jgi:copper homeostasis protein CutC
MLAKQRPVALCLMPVIVTTQEAEIRRILAQGQPQQKSEAISQQTNWVAYSCNPSNMVGLDRKTAI